MVAAPAAALRRGDVVLVETGDFIPGDGEVMEGVASVDESAITGESAPVIRESGGDFSSVTGGTRVLSDWIVVRISADPGETFLDRMIALVESAKRQKTPNEIALTILLVAFTLIFLLATVTLLPYSIYSVESAKAGQVISVTVLVALLVCLIPTTIGGLLSAIGVAGMGRMLQKNVIATSGRAVRRRGTWTCCCSTRPGRLRSATARRQVSCRPPAARSGSSPTRAAGVAGGRNAGGPQHRGLAKEQFGLRERDLHHWERRSCSSAPDPDERRQRRRAPDPEGRRRCDPRLRGIAGRQLSGRRSRPWSIPWRAAVHAAGRGRRARVLGVIELKDIVKGGIKERFAELRQMGIKTIMITGDNRSPRRDRRRGRRRRLPRGSHARGQAEADPRAPGQGASSR
jgi:K+-transporting ATPase ATPase B chain